MGDVKSKFFETTTAAGDAVIAVAARPTSTFTLTTGNGSAAGMGTNIGRKITATTSANCHRRKIRWSHWSRWPSPGKDTRRTRSVSYGLSEKTN